MDIQVGTHLFLDCVRPGRSAVLSQRMMGGLESEPHLRVGGSVPRVYRSMKANIDLSHMPAVGSSASALGIREPNSSNSDVDINNHGTIIQNGRGMSVAAHWRDLPPHRIPRRLRSSLEGASGSDSLRCWCMGEGDFVAGIVCSDLELVLKRGSACRGNLAPTRPMSVSEFQHALAATADQWIIDEGG